MRHCADGRASRCLHDRFPLIFILAWIAQWLAGNAGIKAWGLSYVIFALLIGLSISNTVGVPEWLKPAVRTEYYIKAGLVILGSNILFQEILKAGFLGILQALLVIVVVWYACFWLSRKLRVDDEFAAIIATAVLFAGCRGDRRLRSDPGATAKNCRTRLRWC